jgi:hypothetical protein
MRFRCPRCHTGYELPWEDLPTPGDEKTPYKLKCVRCKCIFMMTVELVSASMQDTAEQSEKDVYYELISPGTTTDEEPQKAVQGESTRKIRYAVGPATDVTTGNGPVVSETFSWEKDNTLDLSDYEIGVFRRAAFIKSMVWGSVAVVFIGFVLFVAYRNDWSISINQLNRDIKRAFSMQTKEDISRDLVQQMTITPGKGYTLKVARGATVGVISGEIQNNTTSDVSHVLLEGRIVDSAENTVGTVIVPCGVKPTDQRLRKARAARIPNMYLKKGVVRNCSIRSGYSKPFKVIFHEMPRNSASTFTFRVVPHSAEPESI